MKETMYMNVTSLVVGGLAIAIACKCTKSAAPLLGFLLIPKWECKPKEA